MPCPSDDPETIYALARIAARRYWRSGRGRKLGTMEDLIQIAALHLCTVLGAFDPARGSISTFIDRVVRRHLSAQESRIRESATLPPDLPAREPADIASVLESLALLDEESRSFICRRYGLGCAPRTLSELASECGLSVSGVHVREQRILSRLRSLLS